MSPRRTSRLHRYIRDAWKSCRLTLAEMAGAPARWLAAQSAERDDAILRLRALCYPSDQAVELIDATPRRDWGYLIEAVMMTGRPAPRAVEEGS